MKERALPFDAYSLRARFFPALLAVLPLFGLVVLFGEGLLDGDLLKGAEKLAISAVILSALAYFAADIARRRGRTYESAFVIRHGWQTTVMLRHRDPSIDATTKKRYHRALRELSKVNLPTESKEAADPAAADEAYRSATKVLLEHRRGEQYKIQLGENALYGFWRNLVAMRSVALSLAGAVAFLAAALLLTSDRNFSSMHAFWTAAAEYSANLRTLTFEITYTVLYLLFVREGVVLEAARTYALALLRTLDTPPEHSS